VRVVWRIEKGRAVRVGYRLHRGPDGERAAVLDVLPQGEFDLQIVIALAYLTYIMRLSLDQACELFQFFWKLPMIKSQADALLNQLARSWEAEFDRISELLSLAAVVWTDETGWKIGGRSDNAAVFANPDHTVLLYGCEKGRATLDRMLPPNVFRGVLVSDDHATYQGLSRMQKCWAHLLRKAIHLVVLYPEHAVYRDFLEELLAVYREAQHRREDGRGVQPTIFQRAASAVPLARRFKLRKSLRPRFFVVDHRLFFCRQRRAHRHADQFLGVSDKSPNLTWGKFPTCPFSSDSSTLETCSTTFVGNVFLKKYLAFLIEKGLRHRKNQAHSGCACCGKLQEKSFKSVVTDMSRSVLGPGGFGRVTSSAPMSDLGSQRI
jgi:hypothetical protein